MKKVRKAIKTALSKVTSKNAPNTYKAIQTERGYQIMEDKMIHLMIDEDMTASETIPHIENTL